MLYVDGSCKIEMSEGIVAGRWQYLNQSFSRFNGLKRKLVWGKYLKTRKKPTIGTQKEFLANHPCYLDFCFKNLGTSAILS